jgi:hypothetical protein
MIVLLSSFLLLFVTFKIVFSFQKFIPFGSKFSYLDMKWRKLILNLYLPSLQQHSSSLFIMKARLFTVNGTIDSPYAQKRSILWRLRSAKQTSCLDLTYIINEIHTHMVGYRNQSHRYLHIIIFVDAENILPIHSEKHCDVW